MFTTTQYVLFALAAIVLIGPTILGKLKSITLPTLPDLGGKDTVDWTLREAVCCCRTEPQVKAYLTVIEAIESHSHAEHK